MRGLWYFSTCASAVSLLSVTPKTKSMTVDSLGGNVTVRRSETIGSSTGPTVLDNADRLCIAAGLTRVPPRPTNRDRSVSKEISPSAPPFPTIMCSSHGGFSS